MKIDVKHRINLSGFVEQDFPYKCPDCETELSTKNIIGFGDYPKGGFRSQLRPNRTLACGFECPKCFTKSCFHDNGTAYQNYVREFKSAMQK